MNTEEFAVHYKAIASNVARDPDVRAAKKERLPNDLTGRAVYQMHQELGRMGDDIPDMAKFAFGQITACVVGKWVEGHKGQVPVTFPIPMDDVIAYYIMYQGFVRDISRSVSGRRDSLGNLTTQNLFNGVYELQRGVLEQNPEAEGFYLAGYNAAIQRLKDLTTQA